MYPGVSANEAQRFSAKPRQLRGEARGWGAPFSTRRGPLGAQDPALNAPHRPQPTTRGLGLGIEAGQSNAKSSTSVFAPVSGCLGGARARGRISQTALSTRHVLTICCRQTGQ